MMSAELTLISDIHIYISFTFIYYQNLINFRGAISKVTFNSNKVKMIMYNNRALYCKIVNSTKSMKII